MKIAVFPGSFNPWHSGHEDVLCKALKIFDKVIVARGFNAAKDNVKPNFAFDPSVEKIQKPNINMVGNWEYMEFSGLLCSFVKEQGATAVVKGLRNDKDFQYELEQQYWNEDLGIEVPTVYIITDRSLVHVSSSAIRLLQRTMPIGAKR